MKLLWVAIAALTPFLLDACGSTAAPVPPAAAGAPQIRPMKKALSIGAFDRYRGGVDSLQSPRLAGLRSAIRNMYRARFSFMSRLTPASLHGLNVVLIGVAYRGDTEIRPLNSREQTLLVNFVVHGGEALLFADNATYFQDASTSLVGPFGVSSGGILSGYQTATWVDESRNPLANGPAGRPGELTTDAPGLLSHYAPAVDLADFAGSRPSAAVYFPAGDLGADSGAAVFFSDSTLLLDRVRTSGDTKAILNALALAR